jgi:beta-galactosidase
MKSVFSYVPGCKFGSFLFFILCCFATTLARAGALIPEAAGRQSIPFNTDWQFHFAYDFEKKAVKQTVTLPHTWNVEDVQQGIDYKKTTGIYEKSLEVTEAMQNKRLFLYFEGANKVATVLINNRFAAEHKGGYTGFAVEITNFIKPGANNVKVLVSNAYRLDVIPLHGDFNMYGGLHRPVSLL